MKSPLILYLRWQVTDPIHVKGLNIENSKSFIDVFI